MSKREKVMEALEDINWNDERIPEIMEDIFNTPMEAISHAEGEFSEEHIESLFETLDLEWDDKEDEDDS